MTDTVYDGMVKRVSLVLLRAQAEVYEGDSDARFRSRYNGSSNIPQNHQYTRMQPLQLFNGYACFQIIVYSKQSFQTDEWLNGFFSEFLMGSTAKQDTI